MTKMSKRPVAQNVATQLISAVIVCNDDQKDLRDCISKVTNVADEIIFAGTGIQDTMLDLDRDLGANVSIVSGHEDLHTILTAAIEKARGEWIVMLKPGEMISVENQPKIRELCTKKEPQLYYLITPINIDDGDLSEYEWVGNRGKYSHNKIGFVQGLEVRLFKKSAFNALLSLDKVSLCPIIIDQNISIPISNIRLNRSERDQESNTGYAKKARWQKDYQRFIGDKGTKVGVRDDLRVLANDYLGFSMLRNDDLPALEAGLEMGFGNVELLKWMVHSFIKEGDYDKAIDFADTILTKLGDHAELWRLKGSAYFYQLNLETAKRCYKKAVSLDKDDSGVLFNLAKIAIISEKYSEAKKILEMLSSTGARSQEISFILRSLEEKHGETAKISLLMLCNNEENYIARAIHSVKGVVDEIILVDTGSKDKSASIARKLGAHVIEHTWKDHFSEARNAGLAHITGDYVLWMDADEFIDNEAKIALLVHKKILPLQKRRAIIFEVQTFKKQQNSPNPLPPEKIIKRTALFPLLPGIRFSGRIFESVDASLKDLNIEFFFAENIHFMHISENTDQRKKRKKCVLEKWTSDPLDIEDIFKGIAYWIDVGNLSKAWEWFGRAISGTAQKKHGIIISYLAGIFAQNNYLKINSPPFETLVKKNQNSYPIISLCAHMLYQGGSYEESARLFEKLLYGGGNGGSYQPHKKTKLKDLVYFIAAHLETNNLKACDKILMELANEEEMHDTFQALLFYYEARKGDIEKAIAILDSWIRTRKLPIKATLNNFVDLTTIITRIAEIMKSYNQIDATTILSQSVHYLAGFINSRE